MSKHAEAAFEIKSWDEVPYESFGDGAKLARVHAIQTYTGAIDGEGIVDYLMMHRADGTAAFIGLERVVGSLGGETGSFVIQHQGSFAHGEAKGVWSVVPNSGTGGLARLGGHGSMASHHGRHGAITFIYAIAAPASAASA